MNTMPFHWFLISICFYGLNLINCMEDAADTNRRGKLNCNLGHLCVPDAGEISYKLEENTKKKTYMIPKF